MDHMVLLYFIKFVSIMPFLFRLSMINNYYLRPKI
jgi:hypothetical protein